MARSATMTVRARETFIGWPPWSALPFVHWIESAISDYAPFPLVNAVCNSTPALEGRRAVSDLITIPARRGKAARVRVGQHVRVINTHGTQVVDAWAFSAADLTEWMAMEASR